MKTTSKKIIAKEIIYFFATITLIVIFWSLIEIRNYYSEKNVKTISNEISAIQLEIDKNEKYDYFKPERWKILINDLTELAKNGSSDAEMKSYCYDFKKKFSKEKNQQLIKKTKILKLKKKILLNNLMSFENYFMKTEEKKNNILLFSILLFSIVYPFRLIYKLIAWSLLTLKKKDL